MAELGVIASVIQIADTGLRLSIKLYTFGELVASADKSVLTLSKDVSLTSSVLKELGQILKNDGKKDAKFLTQTAIKTADDVVKECLDVFKEMETIIIKKMPHLRMPGVEKSSKATILLERLKWPYLQPKLNLLQSNLDRLKSTILLMLNVITYARQVSAKDESETALADQKSLIEDLAQSNQDYIKKFERLKLGIENDPSNPPAAEPHVEANVHSGAQPTINLVNVNAHSKGTSNAANVLKDILETHGPSANDPRLTNLQHYFDMLTTMLKEVDELKYQIQTPSRSRVRIAIHDTFDQEMHFLAHPFGDNLSSRVRDHFACLVAASRDRWYPRGIGLTFSNDISNSSWVPQAAASMSGLRKPSDHDDWAGSSLKQVLTASNQAVVAPPKLGMSQPHMIGSTMPPVPNISDERGEDVVAALKIWTEILSTFKGFVMPRLHEILKVDVADADLKELLPHCNEIQRLKDIIVEQIYLKLDMVESHDPGIIAQKKQLRQLAENYLNSLDQRLQGLLSLKSQTHGGSGKPQMGSGGRKQQNSPLAEYEQQLQLLEQEKSRREKLGHQAQSQALQGPPAYPRPTLPIVQPYDSSQQPQQPDAQQLRLVGSLQERQQQQRQAFQQQQVLRQQQHQQALQQALQQQQGQTLQQQQQQALQQHQQLASRRQQRLAPQQQQSTSVSIAGDQSRVSPRLINEPGSAATRSSLSLPAPPNNMDLQKHRCPYPECGRYFSDLPAHLQTHISDRPEKGRPEISEKEPSVDAALEQMQEASETSSEEADAAMVPPEYLSAFDSSFEASAPRREFGAVRELGAKDSTALGEVFVYAIGTNPSEEERGHPSRQELEEKKRELVGLTKDTGKGDSRPQSAQQRLRRKPHLATTHAYPSTMLEAQPGGAVSEKTGSRSRERLPTPLRELILLEQPQMLMRRARRRSSSIESLSSETSSPQLKRHKSRRKADTRGERETVAAFNPMEDDGDEIHMDMSDEEEVGRPHRRLRQTGLVEYGSHGAELAIEGTEEPMRDFAEEPSVLEEFDFDNFLGGEEFYRDHGEEAMASTEPVVGWETQAVEQKKSAADEYMALWILPDP